MFDASVLGRQAQKLGATRSFELSSSWSPCPESPFQRASDHVHSD